ncbi:MAG: response regulator transcription factor [Lachnospiraceae bacterium]|nr:response regulator transcription factor [Lachnospiraceae bacterium]
MNFYSIAIIEDEQKDRDRIRECLSYLESTSENRFNITEFGSGIPFLDRYRPDYDIVFMDIQLPGMTGMDCARALREKDPSVILIFVTNLAQFAISGYEVDAMDFILKPVNRYSFAMKVSRALARIPRHSDDISLVIRLKEESVVVPQNDIYYIEIDNHDMIYHTSKGDITAYGTLKEREKELSGKGFFRVSAYAIVNLRYVETIYSDDVSVAGNTVHISRNRKKEFLKAFTAFLGRRS